MSTRPNSIVLRDTLTWAGGWLLMFKQAGILFPPPDHVSDSLVIAAVGIVAGPGLLSLLGPIIRPSIGSSPPESPPDPSLSSSPGVSSAGDGE